MNLALFSSSLGLLIAFWSVAPKPADAEELVAAGRQLSSDRSSLTRLTYPSSDGEDRDAFVLLPRGYDDQADRRWPVMLFLYGDGERGNGKEDLDWLLSHGPLYEAWVQGRDLSFVIVAPQLLS